MSGGGGSPLQIIFSYLPQRKIPKDRVFNLYYNVGYLQHTGAEESKFESFISLNLCL